MTSTSVVFGIATLGTPEATPDGDCATDASGRIAMRKGIMNFIGEPRFSLIRFLGLVVPEGAAILFWVSASDLNCSISGTLSYPRARKTVGNKETCEIGPS